MKPGDLVTPKYWRYVCNAPDGGPALVDGLLIFRIDPGSMCLAVAVLSDVTSEELPRPVLVLNKGRLGWTSPFGMEALDETG